MELEHVGIAIGDARSALHLIEALLGERPYKSETVDDEGVRTHFLRAGGAKLELLEALNDESPIARHVEKRGAGLHHLAFEVDDLEAVHERLLNAGFTVLGTPRPGADGKRIFFVHPSDTGGVLFEFCRQSRSILVESTISVAGRSLNVRRGGTQGPAAVVVGELSIDVETLARRLEQSTQVVVVDAHTPIAPLLDALQLDRVHLIAASSFFSLVDVADGRDGLDDTDGSHGRGIPEKPDVRIQSIIVVVDQATDLSLVDRPILVAARPSTAAAATALYERTPDCDLAVGSDVLLARAVETHIRRFDEA